MSQYRQMVVFGAVAASGSLALASRQLELSLATIMRTVAALEQRLSTKLLTRSTRGVRLTEAGEQFAISCRRILEQTEQAEHWAAGLHSHTAGQLTISSPLLMANQILTPLAVEYLDAFPDVWLVNHARETLPRMLEEGIDIALVVGHLPDSSGFAISVGRVKPLICAAPAYLSERGYPGTFDDLRGHSTIQATSAGHGNEWRLQSDNVIRTVRLAPILTCSTQQAAINAAIAGLGLVRCLSYEVDQPLRKRQLEPVLNPLTSPQLPVHLVYREGRRACARVRTFIDFAVPRLRLHPAFDG